MPHPSPRCTVSLRELSLNNVPAIGDLSMVALREHCSKSLESLDISWVRGVSNHALGALVDSCDRLHELTLWGCRQLTPYIFNGHSRQRLTVVGRGASGAIC